MSQKIDYATTQSSPIAIVGISALFPGQSGSQGFWRDIVAGRDNITEVPATHWLIEDYFDPDPQAPDKTYCKRGGFLSPINFDPLKFGIPPKALKNTDTSQLMALIVADRVLHEARDLVRNPIDKERISVILGVASATELVIPLSSRLQRPVWIKAMRESGLPENEVQAICDRIADSYVSWEESSFPGLLGNVVAGRIANRLDIHGTNTVTDAACASSLAALSMGISELQLGRSDLVIAGGVDALNDIFMYMCFSKTPALSPSGDCRPFSDRADGTLLGEGVGMLALRRLDDAERDGNHIYAVIKGLGTSSDGKSTSVYAPRPEGQARALQRAYEDAGYQPDTVSLVEAHGTGTKAGDAAEFAGLKSVFNINPERRQWCALGSVKSQIGHTKAAAGAAGLFKTVMALHHKVLPPTIKVERPNPKLDIENSPFYLNTRSRPWIADASHPRRASVSAFGFGGSNFHVTLEEYTGPGDRALRISSFASELLLWSADTAEELLQKCATSIEDVDTTSFSALARHTQGVFRADKAARLAIIAANSVDLKEKLSQGIKQIKNDPWRNIDLPGGAYYRVGTSGSGQVAFVFPGQGSQYVNMGADLAIAFSEAREVWDQYETGRPAHAPALAPVVFPPPAFEQTQAEQQQQCLTSTQFAQPALANTILSQLAVLKLFGIKPDRVAGHSFGEVMALHAAGVFDRDHALAIAVERARCMTNAAADRAGTMLAVMADRDTVAELLSGFNDDPVLANDNSPEQIIVSGTVENINKAKALLDARGIRTKPLTVASAFHSPLVADATTAFGGFLKGIDWADMTIPVYANVSAGTYPSDAATAKALLAKQISSPVRFRELVESLYVDGVRTFVEVGPGNVLTGLIGQCLGDREHSVINLDRKGMDGVTALWLALGKLAVSGVQPDFSSAFKQFENDDDKEIDSPHSISFAGSNIDKPYPPKDGFSALPPPNREASNNLKMPESKHTNHGQENRQESAIQPAPPIANYTADPFQLHIAQAHQEFQRQMHESHRAFLNLAGEMLAQSGGLKPGLGGLSAPPPSMPLVDSNHFSEHPASPSNVINTDSIAAAVMPVAVQTTNFTADSGHQPNPMPATPTVAKADVSPSLASLLLNIVSEKTGYPLEMLDPTMELEAELGVDSIKQVEILASLQQAAPHLPQIDPAELGRLKTLQDIADYLSDQTDTLHAVELADNRVATSEKVGAATTVDRDIDAILLNIVAEKTGYPPEMLDPTMELEAELGVDSIKQVEILAALKQALPDLPEIEPAQLAQLRTLRAIADAIQPENVANAMTTAATVESDQENPLPAPTAVSDSVTTATNRHTIQRYTLELKKAPASGLGPRLPRHGLFAIIPDHSGEIAQALAQSLSEMQYQARVCESVPENASAVIFLAALGTPADAHASVDLHRQALHAAKSVARKFTQDRGLFVSVQDTGGDFGLGGTCGERAWLGGIPGLIKTARFEWPGASVKAIDIDCRQRSAESIALALRDEIFCGGAEEEVALTADGQRFTLLSCGEPVSAGKADLFNSDSVLLVSGGARGITPDLVTELARKHGLCVVLLGRTELTEEPSCTQGIQDEAEMKRVLLDDSLSSDSSLSPLELNTLVRRILAQREITDTLERIDHAGGRSVYLSVDVRDSAAVTEAVQKIRSQHGPVSAIIHAAGVLADKLIADKSDEQFERVFTTKVLGLDALLQATQNDPLQLICLFSSVAARCGNVGQADYAMANEVLNKIANVEAARRGNTCLVKSINWGPWDGGMVNDALRQRFASLGVALVDREAGRRFFLNEIGSNTSKNVEIVAGGRFNKYSVLQAGQMLKPVRMQISVSHRTHPYLASHVIEDAPVLPVVMVIEWFTRVSASLARDLVPAKLQDIEVIKGVRLDRFHDEGNTLQIQCLPKLAGDMQICAFDLALLDTENRVRYRAVMEMGSGPSTPADATTYESKTGMENWPWTATEAYKHGLFHGSHFHVLEQLEGIDDDGANAALCGIVDKNWSDENWMTDAAALDGALQLAILWGLNHSGKTSLPTRVAECSIYAPPQSGLIKCHLLTVRNLSSLGNEFEIILTHADNSVFAELKGVQMYQYQVTDKNPEYALPN